MIKIFYCNNLTRQAESGTTEISTAEPKGGSMWLRIPKNKKMFYFFHCDGPGFDI